MASAHDPLRLAAGVLLGVVEEVDAGVVGRAPGTSSARLPMSSWGPKVTHEPKESTLTCSPDPPSRRYSINRPDLLSLAGMSRHPRGSARPTVVRGLS